VKGSPLTDTCLKRPVMTTMIFTALVAVGVASLIQIPLETYPELQIPRLNISGSWSNASTEAVEAFVTAPLEAEASTLRGIEEVSSTSRRGICTVTLEFAPDTDMDFTRLELNEKISRLREDLPQNVHVSVQPYRPPQVQSQTEFLLRYTYFGQYSVNELQHYAEELLEAPLSVVSGVAGVTVRGGEQRQLKVILDESIVESLGLEPRWVSMQIGRIDNIVETVGTVYQTDKQFNLVVRDDFDDLETLRDVTIARLGDRWIKLGEIARIMDGYHEPQSYDRLNGVARVSVTIDAVSGSNIIEVADRTKDRISELEADLPEGSNLILEADASETIRNELGNLRFRSIIIIFLIFAVLLMFLRGFANPLIILSSIATSVLLTISIFYFTGGSLNMMTLAGLAMGMGMMVDNSIVVLDNIHRHRERGSGRLAAASVGTARMMLPILAGTATTIVVFLPFLYLQGDLRVLYVPFALAVVVSLACSLLVSFTLIPSLAAKVIGPAKKSNGRFSGKAAGRVKNNDPVDPWALGELEREEAEATAAGGEEAGAEHVLKIGDNLYQRILRWMLHYRLWMILAVLVVGFFSFKAFDKYVTKGRIWGSYGSGQRETLGVTISAPTGSDLDVMSDLVGQFESKLRPLYLAGQIEKFTTSVSAEHASLRITFPEAIERQGLPYLVKDQLSVFSSLMGGVRISVSGFGDYFSTGGFGGVSYSSRIALLGYNYLRLKELAEELGQRLLRNARIRDVDTNYGRWYGSGREKQIVVRFDRDALADYGLTAQDMVSFVGQYISGTAGGSVTYRGEEVPFLVKVEGFESRDIVELENALIRTMDGTHVRMRDLATISVERVMEIIERKDQQYTRTIAYEFRGPYRMGERVRDEIMEATILPNGYEFDEQERYWQSEEEKRQLYLVLGFAILLVYMLTSSLYESFFHPLTIILTVPFAMIGVFLGYFIFDKGFDQSAQVGVILMGGIVVNNSIILVDHINALRKFLPRRDAVVRAARERARPILMTTFTTVIGLLPLVVLAREGQDMWFTLAFTICVALPVATFFTLTFIPIIYELMDGLQNRARRGIGAAILKVQSRRGDSPAGRVAGQSAPGTAALAEDSSPPG